MNRIPILEKRSRTDFSSREQFEEYKLHQTAELENAERKPARFDPGVVRQRKRRPSHPKVSSASVATPMSKENRSSPAFVSVLSPPEPELKPNNNGKTTGRRLVLANWIASPENPLTARVMANRIWQYHFGRGIVRSSSDFGFQGTPPTHPELLDWLATELIRQNWSMKAMHRLIMHPAPIACPVVLIETCDEVDPDNDLFLAV